MRLEYFATGISGWNRRTQGGRRADAYANCDSSLKFRRLDRPFVRLSQDLFLHFAVDPKSWAREESEMKVALDR